LPEFVSLPEDHQAIFASVILAIWPVLSLLIFLYCKTFSRGLIWSVLAAQLLLPVGFSLKFQMVPQIDKVSIGNLGALLGCIFFGKRKLIRSWRIGLVEILLLLNIFSPIITSELNFDNIVVGTRFIQGVGLYDAISAAETSLISLVPFLLGRRFLRAAGDPLNILMTLVIANLFYTLPLLFEIRFSPQLHFWVYGFYPTDFVQTMRQGGFRPMVFMGHGLLASFFLATGVLAATALWRNQIQIGKVSSGIVTAYTGLVLLLCKSFGALIYSVAGFLVIFFTKPRTQIRIAALLATISLAYPVLRSLDLVPTSLFISIAKSIDADRAQSLEFRFDNEDQLLKRAFERPWFGWGRYGRSRIYDTESGKDNSVTDGRWVIDLGQFGLIGFFSEFGLLATCIYRAASRFRIVRSANEQLLMATLTLIVSINIFDLLPNSGLIPWTWLMAGALLGYSEALAAKRAPTLSASHPNGLEHKALVHALLASAVRTSC
jgi:hypothetical protein